jgi:hypothetical protein
VTAASTSCASASSTSFTNATKLAAPAVPVAVTAASCSADGTTTISNYDAKTYTFSPATSELPLVVWD